MIARLALCLALLAPFVARAEDASDTEGEYTRTMTRGIAEFDAARFDEARALFRQAHALSPSARTWRVLGMTAFELRLYPLAIEELSAALTDERRPLTEVLHAQVVDLLAQASVFVGRFRLTLDPPDAQLTLDDAHAEGGTLVLGVGEHHVSVRAPGYLPVHQTWHVHGREDEARTITLEPVQVASAPPAPLLVAPPRDAPPRRARALRIGAYASAGAAASALLLGGVFGGLAIARENTLDGACTNKLCTPDRQDDIDQMRRFANVSTGALVVGVGVGVLATVLWFRARSAAHAERARWTTGRVEF